MRLPQSLADRRLRHRQVLEVLFVEVQGLQSWAWVPQLPLEGPSAAVEVLVCSIPESSVAASPWLLEVEQTFGVVLRVEGLPEELLYLER